MGAHLPILALVSVTTLLKLLKAAAVSETQVLPAELPPRARDISHSPQEHPRGAQQAPQALEWMWGAQGRPGGACQEQPPWGSRMARHRVGGEASRAPSPFTLAGPSPLPQTLFTLFGIVPKRATSPCLGHMASLSQL